MSQILRFAQDDTEAKGDTWCSSGKVWYDQVMRSGPVLKEAMGDNREQQWYQEKPARGANR